MAKIAETVLDYTDDLEDVIGEVRGGTIDFMAYRDAMTILTNQGKLRSYIFRVLDNNVPDEITAICVVTRNLKLDKALYEGGLMRVEGVRIEQKQRVLEGGVMRPVVGRIRRLGSGQGPEARYLRWFPEPLNAMGACACDAEGKVLASTIVCLPEVVGGPHVGRPEANARLEALPDDYFDVMDAAMKEAMPGDVAAALDGQQRLRVSGLLH